MIFTTNHDENIYSFAREKQGDKVIAIFNFSPAEQTATINSSLLAGSYKNLFTGATLKLQEKETFELGSQGYLIFTNTVFNP